MNKQHKYHLLAGVVNKSKYEAKSWYFCFPCSIHTKPKNYYYFSMRVVTSGIRAWVKTLRSKCDPNQKIKITM